MTSIRSKAENLLQPILEQGIELDVLEEMLEILELSVAKARELQEEEFTIESLTE